MRHARLEPAGFGLSARNSIEAQAAAENPQESGLRAKLPPEEARAKEHPDGGKQGAQGGKREIATRDPTLEDVPDARWWINLTLAGEEEPQLSARQVAGGYRHDPERHVQERLIYRGVNVYSCAME